MSEAAAETTDIVWPANLGVCGMEGTQKVVGTWGAGSVGDMDGTSSVPPPLQDAAEVGGSQWLFLG